MSVSFHVCINWGMRHRTLTGLGRCGIAPLHNIENNIQFAEFVVLFEILPSSWRETTSSKIVQQLVPPLPSRRQRAICSFPHPKAKNAKFSSLAHDADGWSSSLTFPTWVVWVVLSLFPLRLLLLEQSSHMLSQWLGSCTSLFDWPFDDRTAVDFRENVL